MLIFRIIHETLFYEKIGYFESYRYCLLLVRKVNITFRIMAIYFFLFILAKIADKMKQLDQKGKFYIST